MAFPQLRLDDLLEELQARLSEVRATRDRVHSLLEAVLAVGSDLDLQTVLRRITEAASTLAGARYAALGVIGDDERLSQFVTVGMSEQERGRLGSPPRGHGILGILIRDPRPLRLDDLSSDPAAYGFPPGHPPMTTFLGVPIRVRDEVFGNLYLTEKVGGGAFDEEDEAVVLALAAAAGVAIENARLYDTARRRASWLRANADISTRLLAGADPDEVLSRVAAHARELCRASACFIALPTGADRLLVEVAEGAQSAAILGRVLQVATTSCGSVLRSGTPQLLVGEAAASVVSADVAESALLVPLGAQGAARGVLVVTTGRSEPPVLGSVVEELNAFAAQATVALEVAERRRDAEQLVVYEDRDRIARDLHDLVIQQLFATGMQLESTARLIDRPDAAARVRRAVDDLDSTIREIRSTIYALTTEPSGETDSLRSRFFDVIDAGTEQLGHTPAVRMAGLVDSSVPSPIAEHLLAVLREALSNAARHAEARRVEVVLDVGARVSLTVRDDGRGLPSTLQRRSGLAHLEARAREVGGTFTIGPAEGSGTELVWTAPLPVSG